MLNFVLKQALNGAVTDLAAGVYATQSQSLYTLTVAGSDTIPDGLKLQRDGDDLVMLVDGEEVSRLTEFYSDEMAAQFSVNGSVDAASAEIGTSTLAELEGSGLVWPENELLAGLSEPASQLITPLNVAAAVAVAGGVVVANDSDSAPAPAPTLVISGGSDTPTNSDVTFTFTFDIDVEGFTADDVVVTGGTKGSFTAVSATEYTLVVTPDDDSTDDITVDVAAGAAQSTAGTDTEAAEQETQAVDTAVEPPTLSYTDSADASDQLTNDATVAVSDLDAGASWEYSTDSGSSWTAGSGSSFELSDGSYGSGQVQVRQTDVVGNISDPASLSAVTVDTEVATPTVDITTDSADGSDRITNDATITVTGLESGASWEYSLDGGSNWSAGDSSDNSFELADGGYEIGDVVVRQTDIAGNVSSSGALAAATVDTTIATPALELASDSNIDDDRVTNDATIDVTGLDSTASWEYSIDGGSNWAAGSGSSFELDDGSYDSDDVLVRQTDVAGNVSGEAALQAAVIDTAAPAVLGIALDEDSGESASDNISSDGTVVISGLESGATWQYRYDGINWTAGSGSSFELAEGSYTAVQVRQIDLAGNEGPFFDGSSSADLGATVIDQTAPDLGLVDIVDTGISDSDGVTSTDTFTVTGLESGADWEYSVDGGSNWSTGSGNSFSVEDGAYFISVRQTDLAGNSDSYSSDLALTVDTTVATPTVNLFSDSADGSDRITNDATITVTGLEAGASWEYSLDGGSNWSTGDSSDNTFELADGSYDSDDVLVRQTDLAGNLSSNGALAAATIDTVAPAAPSVALVDAGSGGSTSDATVTISGLEADVSWEYSTDSGSIWTPGDSSDNTFELADGSYATGQVAVRQTDVAGNVGLPTALTESFTVTTTAPTVVIFDFVTGKSSTVGGSRTFAADVDYEIYFIVSSVSASLVNVEQQWGGNLSLDANDKIIMLGDNNGVSAGGYGPVFHYRDTLSDLTAETVSRVDFAPYSSFYPMLAYRWETSEGDLGLALLTESFSGQYVVRQLSLLTEGVRRTVTGFSNPFKSTVNLNFGSGSLNRAQMSVVTTLPLFNISGSSYAWNGSALALTTPP